jgi:Predicted metal-binding integral membrane protein (DUF2182)
MAALFALGVMSVGWMVLVAARIAVEKLLPWRTVATRGIAVLLAVLAIALAFAPEDVPGLTVPGWPAAARAMEEMGWSRTEQTISPQHVRINGRVGRIRRAETTPSGAPRL